ncbi:hypothetical protein [Haloarcula sp. CGMCC 1.6347]|uniref:hypothetical protein n=1 Tax=Haloarcula sp. CGMCC 1.6347 TaxID=3111455 RepID=UPI00300E8CC3
MSTKLTWTVEVSDDDAEALAEFDDERISDELVSTFEELASVHEKQDELRSRRPEASEDTEELSGEALEEAIQGWLRGDRRKDPRLD